MTPLGLENQETPTAASTKPRCVCGDLVSAHVRTVRGFTRCMRFGCTCDFLIPLDSFA